MAATVQDQVTVEIHHVQPAASVQVPETVAMPRVIIVATVWAQQTVAVHHVPMGVSLREQQNVVLRALVVASV